MSQTVCRRRADRLCPVCRRVYQHFRIDGTALLYGHDDIGPDGARIIWCIIHNGTTVRGVAFGDDGSSDPR